MGQYYKAIVPTTKEYVSSYTFNNGAKLMEHSWMRNPFVKFVESLIVEGGVWFGKPLVWAGDYADPEVDGDGNVIKIMSEGKEYEANLYSLKEIEIKPSLNFKEKHYRYLINETKKEFVDKNKCPKDEDGWRLHPLPLLTSDGNGRGGGDYSGDNMEYVGRWARDIIKVSTKKPIGYSELKPDFIERW
jgi:hypothetical protein